MRRISSNSESGAILAIVIILMLALTITGIAFLNAGVMEYRLAKKEDYKNKAFYIAEGGLERTIWNLKEDFESGNRDWTDDINGVPVEVTGAEWKVLQYGDSPHTPALSAGVYQVKLKKVDEDEIWVRSTGTVKDIPRTVQMYVSIANISPWNNAIFAGKSATEGSVIKGNARIYGSVHILGEDPVSGEQLTSDDFAMDMSGTGGIRNNYEDMPGELADRVPGGPETVKSLGAELRVKHGMVGLSGTATVGKPDDPGDPFDLKEMMDGVYVMDGGEGGYGGNQGVINVHSDNGTAYGYDLSDSVKFPQLSDFYVNPVTGDPYVNPVTGGPLTYLDYLKLCAVYIPEDEISSDTVFPEDGYFSPTPYDDPVTGEIGKISSINWSWNEDEGKGILDVNGVVWVAAASLELGKNKETIEYSGNGIIVVGSTDGQPLGGNIRIVAHLLAKGTYAPGGEGGFPNNVFGLIASNIYLAPDPADSQLTMTGAFYAENEIISKKQNEIAGTFVCSKFNISEQVPRIYQVPELANNLPPGMPGGTPIWSISTSQWSES